MENEDNEGDLKNADFYKAVMEAANNQFPEDCENVSKMRAHETVSTQIIFFSYAFASITIPQINWDIPALLLLQLLLAMFLGYSWNNSTQLAELRGYVYKASINNAILSLKTQKRNEAPIYGWLVNQGKMAKSDTIPLKGLLKYLFRIVGLYILILLPPLIGWGLRGSAY